MAGIKVIYTAVCKLSPTGPKHHDPRKCPGGNEFCSIEFKSIINDPSISVIGMIWSAKTKNPDAKFSNRVSAGILATLINVGCNSRKSSHLIYSFLNFYLIVGGDLDLKAKNLTQWRGLMIPFAISTSWFP